MCYITGHIYTVQENKKYLCESRIFDMDVEVIYNEMFYIAIPNKYNKAVMSY